MLNSAWKLAKNELKIQTMPLMGSVFVAFIFALLTAVTLEQLVVQLDNYNVTGTRLILDIIFLGLTPSFSALLMSTPYLRFRTIWEDPFSKRMAFYRSLPIPLNVLAMSRTILSLMVFVIMSVVFYTAVLIYLVRSEYFLDYINPTELAMFSILWFGYALLLSGSNTYIESGTNGKVLHSLPYFNLLLLLIIFVVIYNVTDKGIVEWSLLFIQYTGWLGVLAVLLCGVAGCYGWHTLLTRRLSTRDYL